ncbi:MAG: DUF5919 domain-containing protein [Candidatus Bathyarchaeota archaeon]
MKIKSVLAKQVHLGFLGTATILILMAIIFYYQGNLFLSDLLFELGVAVAGITVIEFIWRTFGGDPLSKLVNQLAQIIPLLESQRKFGIKQIYANRGEVRIDEWLGHLKKARQVDMMGISLRQNWASNKTFLETLEENARKKRCIFRVLILDPVSNVCIRRAQEEGDKLGRIAITAKDSLSQFLEMKKKLENSEANNYLQLKVIREHNLYCSVIRIDEKMLVTFYLSNVRGRNSPTLEIYGDQSPLFNKFSQEFEKMWETSSPVSNSIQ